MVTFQNDPYNQSHWEGPEEGLKWPEKPLGRPVSVPKMSSQRWTSISTNSEHRIFNLPESSQGRSNTVFLCHEIGTNGMLTRMCARTRATRRMAFKELNLKLPKSLAASSRAFLRLRNYTIRTVTNTAMDLNEEHVELMNECRSKL
jgi:hypothetical protein